MKPEKDAFMARSYLNQTWLGHQLVFEDLKKVNYLFIHPTLLRPIFVAKCDQNVTHRQLYFYYEKYSTSRKIHYLFATFYATICPSSNPSTYYGLL